jgi:hypothetical protein
MSEFPTTQFLSRMVMGLTAILAILDGCGGGDGGPTGPAADINGTWTYFETFGDPQNQVTCTGAGTIDITQSGEQFTARVDHTGSCVVPGGFVDNSGTETFSGGLSLTTVEFAFGGCDYRGNLFGSPADSAAGTMACDIRDESLVLQLNGTWFAVRGIDFDSPRVSGTVSYPQGDTLLLPGDLFSVTLTATDDRKVAWAGYRLGPPANKADSVRVDAREHTNTFSVTVPAGWTGLSTLTLFARDALDRPFEMPAGTIRVLDAIRRPVQTIPLGGMFTIATDIVYDPKRNALYLLEGEAGQIAVLSLSTFTFGSPLPLPGPLPGSRRAEMDITPGSDSLVVPIANTSIGFINLVTGATATVPITSDLGNTQSIGETHALQNRKVFVFGMWSDVGVSADALWEYDLATGTHRRRTDVGINGNITLSERARSHDHRRFLQLDKNRNCGQIYDSATQTFSTCVSVGYPVPSTPTGTTTGDRWLVGNLVLDGALNTLATLSPPIPTRGAIAPDGSAAYYPTEYGYVKLRLPDGAILERVRIPIRATRVTALPDGDRLVIWTDPGATSELLTTNRVTIVQAR